ncbi:putative peptidoglycan linked protein [Listeria grayi FSL F6-1183]|uniref:Putative peptidoglycan linked protein n=1 Tax=Listeria grayi FSL F6-1183 TaxID=1265827 RepID=A0A829R787_LISGR|nr:putative peptidoglycan linked protein [Listeria grayi FSL F6-1183]
MTSKIKVTENTVNTAVAGTYSVTYSVTDSDGNTVTKTISVIVVKPSNHKPMINANDVTLKVGDSFNPLSGVTATDIEDGDLTSKIKVEANTVNTAQAGTYAVTYSVTDSDGNRTVKSIIVVVKNNSQPTIYANDVVLKVGDTFDPLSGVSAMDEEDGDLTSKILVTANTVNTAKAGTYAVIYEVTDSDGNTATKIISVIVKAKSQPIINANDVILKVGDSFNPLSGVTAMDAEDGDLTSKIVVIANTVNTAKPGNYSVVYSVTNSDGNTATKAITVTVKNNSQPIINANDKTIKVGDTFNPLSGVTATDEEDGDLTSKIKVIVNTVNTAVAGTYTVTYSVTDSDGNTATKTITVTVKTNSQPVINAKDVALKVGDTFNPLSGVTAMDLEDGDLTSKIIVTANTVNTMQKGTYSVTYTVMDSDGNITTKTITVTVKNNSQPTINANDKTIKVGDTFNPLSGVTATDAEDGDLTSKVKVTANTVNTAVAGTYTVTYSVTDSDGNTVTKTITVSVEAKEDYSISANKYNIDSSSYLTGTVGESVAKIRVYVNGKLINIVTPTNNSFKAYVRSYVTHVTDVVKVVSLDKEGGEREEALVALTYNDILLTVDEYVIGESESVTGTIDSRATSATLYDADTNTALRKVNVSGGTYKISAVDLITSAAKNYVVVAKEGTTELKRITVKVTEADPTNYTLTADDYQIGDTYISGTYDKAATKVVLYVDGKAVKNSTLDPATMTYRLQAKGFVTSATQKVEMVMSKGSTELKRVTVKVTEADPTNYTLTADDYQIGDTYISGTYDKAATKVVLYVDGKAVKNSTLDPATMTYRLQAKGFVTSANQKVEMVMSKGSTELKRITVKVTEENPTRLYVDRR